MTEQSGNIHKFRHRSDTMLRVAAVHLPRLEPEDRAALRPFIEQDMRHLQQVNGKETR